MDLSDSFLNHNSKRVPVSWGCLLGFPGTSVVKNLPGNAGDVRLTPGTGRSPKEEMTTHSSILAWEMPWTEEPGKLQSMGPQKSQALLND